MNHPIEEPLTRLDRLQILARTIEDALVYIETQQGRVSTPPEPMILVGALGVLDGHVNARSAADVPTEPVLPLPTAMLESFLLEAGSTLALLARPDGAAPAPAQETADEAFLRLLTAAETAAVKGQPDVAMRLQSIAELRMSYVDRERVTRRAAATAKPALATAAKLPAPTFPIATPIPFSCYEFLVEPGTLHDGHPVPGVYVYHAELGAGEAGRTYETISTAAARDLALALVAAADAADARSKVGA